MAQKKYLDDAGLVELVGKIKSLVQNYGALLYKGSVATVSALPAVAGAKVGDMYTVLAEGTTTADFTDGEGLVVAANSEVVAVNIGTAQSPTMKWDLLGPVFDVSDKLTFGTTMPSSPNNGDTFLYLGTTTYTYDPVTPQTGDNPQALGWYEYDASTQTYVLSTDTEVQAGTSYFVKNEEYVQGVIYRYSTASSSWIPLSSGDIMVPITTGEIDALFN